MWIFAVDDVVEIFSMVERLCNLFVKLLIPLSQDFDTFDKSITKN